MKLKDALSKIFPAQGATTVMSALMTGDFSSVKEVGIVEKGINELEQELKETIEAQRNCGSDWAYWGYEGTISYLKSAIHILKAAKMVGEDNLADIDAPNSNGVVIDVQANVERFGEKIYQEALKVSVSAPPREGR